MLVRRLLTGVSLCIFITLSVVACSNPSNNQPYITENYKKIYYGAEIPVNWSYSLGGDIRFGRLMSISATSIYFNDWNANQIDIEKIAPDDIRHRIENMHEDKSIFWSTEFLANRKAEVAKLPLDNDKVTKFGTGGKIYFIIWNYTKKNPSQNVMSKTAEIGLVINKQAQGDDQFEKSFEYFLSTFDFDQFSEDNFNDYLQ